MTFQFRASTVSEMLPTLLNDLMVHGDEVGSRNGRVKELLNPQIEILHPLDREVLSIGRGANVFAQIAETMWVLAGRNDVEWLGGYLPRAKDYSDNGHEWRGGYGPRIRQSHFDVDQLDHVVSLLREDPLSRRAVISIYDPRVDTSPGKDIPCNDFLQFQNRLGQLHLTVTVRSNDVMWGWSGINAFEWSTLQEIVASMLGVQVGSLVFNVGSLHLYERHWGRAGRISYERASMSSPRFNTDGFITDVGGLDHDLDEWFHWEGLCRKGEARLENLDIVDPMFRSWAMAIAYYWQRGGEWLPEVAGTALAVAMVRTPASVLPEPVQRPQSVAQATGAPQVPALATDPLLAFYRFVANLHKEKHESYGSSWRKRGEVMSILPNIARKIDRLGVGDSFDSSADTVIDLWVYLGKYLSWLENPDWGTPDRVNPILYHSLHDTAENAPEIGWEKSLPQEFDKFVEDVLNDRMNAASKRGLVRVWIARVAPIARDLWYMENEYRGANID